MTDFEKFFFDYKNIGNEIVWVYNGKPVYSKDLFDAPEFVQEKCIPIYKRIICNDGFSMSVQMSCGHHCKPMITLYLTWECIYTHVEVGFPSQIEELLLPYIEDQKNPTDTIYNIVPRTIIDTIIEKHGWINFDYYE